MLIATIIGDYLTIPSLCTCLIRAQLCSPGSAVMGFKKFYLSAKDRNCRRELMQCAYGRRKCLVIDNLQTSHIV